MNEMMILFTNPSARAGYDTRSIFKQSFSDSSGKLSANASVENFQMNEMMIELKKDVEHECDVCSNCKWKPLKGPRRPGK